MNGRENHIGSWMANPFYALLFTRRAGPPWARYDAYYWRIHFYSAPRFSDHIETVRGGLSHPGVTAHDARRLMSYELARHKCFATLEEGGRIVDMVLPSGGSAGEQPKSNRKPVGGRLAVRRIPRSPRDTLPWVVTYRGATIARAGSMGMAIAAAQYARSTQRLPPPSWASWEEVRRARSQRVWRS